MPDAPSRAPIAVTIEGTVAAIRPLDRSAADAARALHTRLTKPAGSLGALEELGVRLAGLAGVCPPPLPSPAAVAIFAGDHGVHAQGVTPWPQEVTAQMVGNFLAGGAVVNAFAREVGAAVTVVDVGVATSLHAGAPAPLDPVGLAVPDAGAVAALDPVGLAVPDAGATALLDPVGLAVPDAGATAALDPVGPGVRDAGAVAPLGRDADTPSAGDGSPRLLHRRVRAGTADFTAGPAMSLAEARAAVTIGIEVAGDLVSSGAAVLVTGDMGIANTTAAAALIAAFTGVPAATATGRGTGIDDQTLAHKVEVVAAGLRRHSPDPTDPLGTLAALGGLEHAALAGFVLGAAALRVPVILDGVNAVAAALAAVAFAPSAADAMVAGHRSAEPGATVALDALRLTPLVDLGMRLGEASGALLALPLVAAAARTLREVATFDSAGVTDKGAPGDPAGEGTGTAADHRAAGT